MSSSVDAITSGSILNAIKKSTRAELLSYISCVNTKDLKELLTASCLFAQIPSKLQSKVNCDGYINSIINNVNKSQHQHRNPNNKHPFTSLPTTIGGYILSFCTMRDRAKSEFVSRDIYRFSQDPNAKYHLCIDQQFCRGLHQNQIRINKYFNAQQLEIKYVFKDGTFEKFEDKYYSTIAKIISKSPLLHTLQYNIKHGKIRTKLNSTSSGDSYYGDSGHLLHWIEKIKNNNNSKPNAFKSVVNLIWNPSQFRGGYSGEHNSIYRQKISMFLTFLPNLTSFTCPKPRLYGNIRNLDDNDCLWNIFKCPNYYDKLVHIDINMTMSNHSKFNWWFNTARTKHINLENHPLTHFWKFKKLKSLKLKLPIFRECKSYYGRYLNNIDVLASTMKSHEKLEELTSVYIEFVGSQYNLCNDEGIHCADLGITAIINGLCKYILCRCPNLREYTFLCNDTRALAKNLNHLLPFHGKLESLTTDCSELIGDDARMISLKKLTVKLGLNEDLESMYKNLNGFTNLESFHCVYTQTSVTDRKYPLIKKIKQFLKYVSGQIKNNDKLKWFGIHHNVSKALKKLRKSKLRMQLFAQSEITNSSSLELCKSLIRLLTENDIKSISITPIILKQSEMEYLYFWFGNKYGILDTGNYEIKRDLVLTDLTCANSS